MFRLAHTPEFSEHVSKEIVDFQTWPSKNYSAFMSYDFHIGSTGPKLIEVNTNASSFSYTALLSEFRSSEIGEITPKTDLFEDCRAMLEEECTTKIQNIAIVDSHPEKQRAYSEFLIFKALFESWGWRVEILDINELEFKNNRLISRKTQSTFDLIYNRHTDFYFTDENSKYLKSAYLSEDCITPNPREYALLADKERLFYFKNIPLLKKIGATDEEILTLSSMIPEVLPIQAFDKIGSRKAREKYFFKPLRSHGGKAVYKGKSISQKIFEDIFYQPYMAMESIEPPTVTFQHDGLDLTFKWDLRVYAYKNKIMGLVARLYQGQLTNTQTMGGGLSAVKVI